MTDVLITAGELAEFLKKEPCVVIDTRNPEAYGAGHLAGAVNVHEIFTYLATSTPEGMQELKTKFADAFGAAGLSGKETAVIYEQSMNSGFGQSCRGYFLLTMLGYPKIKVLHGGYDAWAAAGLPVTKDVPSPMKASFTVVPEAGDILIDAKTMLAAVGKPGIALLDVRDIDEWIGESSSPYGKDFCPRKGRIPGAVWLEWYRMMKPTAEGPRFKSKNEILAECATVGITPNTTVYLYCFKGARGLEHIPRAKERWRKGRPDVFWLLERMVAGSVAADRGGAADGGQAHHQGGVRLRPMLQSDPSGSDCSHPPAISHHFDCASWWNHRTAPLWRSSAPEGIFLGALGGCADVDVLTQIWSCNGRSDAVPGRASGPRAGLAGKLLDSGLADGIQRCCG